METEQNNLSDKGTLKLILDNKSQYVQQQAPQVQQYYGQTQNQPLNMLQNYGQQQSYYPYSGYNYSSFYGQQNYQQTQPQSQQQPQQYPYQQQQQQPQQYPYQQLQQQPYQYQQQQQQQSQPQANYYQNPMFNYNFYQQQPQNVINVSKESHISQAVQQQYQSKIIEDDEPDIEGPSRWSEEIKIYAHLYRRLQIAIPNVISAQFCKGRQIYSQQSLISVKQYVERAFEKCQSDYERSQMELYVKQTLEDSKKRNEYYSRDWARFPIPKLPRETQFIIYQHDFRQKVMFTQNIPPTIKFPYNNMAPSYSMLQDKINGSKFGTPSAPVASLPTISKHQYIQVQVANTKFTENMMSLYDVMKEKQIQNINIKKRPVSYNMDFMLLQANKQKTMVTTTTTQQIKAHQQYLRKNEEDDEGISDQKIIGSCQDLEKQYFRLTGLPDPCTIRPEAILKKSLDFIMGKWKEGEVEYDYIIGQFRSIRQDLMVQHIQNNFAVQVYEENARISLECGDFPRYETCWTMLSDLYEIVSHGEGKQLSKVGKKTEFDSYRIVYLTMLGKQDKLVIIMNQQDNDDDEQIKLALEIRSAYQTGNYVKLFQLYKISSETMESLINQFLLRIRVKALKQFMRSFVGTLEVDYLAEVLAFQSVEHFKSFLGYFDQCKLDKEEKGVLIKESFTAFDVVNFDKIND